MAAVPQPNLPEIEDEASYVLPPDHHLPGCSVDALLAEDKVDEARAELERLLDEGINSGPGVLIDDEFWNRLHARARSRASQKDELLTFSVRNPTSGRAGFGRT